MKCNAVILASLALGQSVMATNIHRPGGHFQMRSFNGSEPFFPSGVAPSSGFPVPTGKPSFTSSKKPCKTKSSSAVASSVASSVASAVASSIPSSVATTSSQAPIATSQAPAATSAPATSTSEASSSTTAVLMPSSLKSQDVDTSSTFIAPATSSKAPANSLPPYPTTFSTGASPTIASTGFASGTGASAYPSSTAISAYYQCGGIGYTGATTCVEGAICQVQNPYYSQCIYQS